MKRRLLIPFAVLLLLAAGAGGWYLALALSPQAPPPAPAPAAGARVETAGGETVVVIPADMQRASGIAVIPLAAARARPALTAYATVIDPQPLFDLATRLAAARSDHAAARAQAGASAAQAARVQALFQDERNASQKSLQDARAAAQADQAKLTASAATLAGIEASLRQQFGDALARAAHAPGSGPWRRLVSGQAAVVRVVFPSGEPAPPAVALELPGGGELSAQRLSAAPQVDPLLQGAAQFYLAAAALPAGTRTLAHTRDARAGAAQVPVPDAAIVWYGDTRWAYVRVAPERFARRLAPGALRAGDQVVTRGAALLLSEEQRPRAIATQCKAPPECDD